MKNSLPLYLAPLEGLTNYLFRKTFFTHFTGVNKAFTPFMATNKHRSFKKRDLKELEKLKDVKIIPQIMSNNAEDFIDMSRQLFDLGFDEINWNTGCPYPTVITKKKGAGLLPYPHLIDSILEQFFTHSPCRLSVKTRIGNRIKDEFLFLIPVFNKYPLAELIIHPRTAVQKYAGICDIEFIKSVINDIAHPVCYSGDINSLSDYQNITNFIPDLQSVMMGRGAIIRPFVFEEILNNKLVSFKEGNKRVLDFQHDLLLHYESILSGDAHLLHKMKDYWKHFGQYLGSDKKLNKILTSKTKQAFIAAVGSYYSEQE